MECRFVGEERQQGLLGSSEWGAWHGATSAIGGQPRWVAALVRVRRWRGGVGCAGADGPSDVGGLIG
jgi:hypothetical protein